MRPMAVGVVRGVALTLALCLAAVPALGQGEAADDISLQRALYGSFDLTLEKVTLPEAFRKIEAEAKLPAGTIVVLEEAYAALPFGATTRVNAEFRAAALGVSLDDMLLPLGLEKNVSGGHILVRPTAALARIGRRATFEELRLLQNLRTTQLPTVSGDWTTDLRTLLGKPDLTMQISTTDEAAKTHGLEQVRAMLPVPSVAQALDVYAADTHQLWTVEGQNILVLPLRQWIERQLKRPVDVDRKAARLEVIVADMARQSGVRFQPDPGLYISAPAVTLNNQRNSLQLTLDTLAGITGVSYEVKDDCIALHKPGGETTPTPTRDAIVGRITVPIGPNALPFDIFVHESDLPPELNEKRKEKIAETIRDLSKAVAATKPAGTQPTPK